MKPAGMLALCVLAFAAGSGAALAQSVISARSGMIHYVEGQVYLGDQLVESKFGSFPAVKENGELRTGEGRAEVLLTPGIFLRLGENSSFRMITNRLIDTRLELLSGSAIVEADDIPKDNSVTVVYKDAAVHFAKKGLYRFDSSAGELRVFDGEAGVTAGDKTVEVKEGHLIALDTLAMSKFDKTTTDALNRWSARRAEYVSMANVSAANSLRSSGSGFYSSGWYFNPYFGMFTFVPGLAGTWYSPYGFRFWSPFDVYQAYIPGYYYTPTYSAYNNAGRSSVPVATSTSTSRGIAAAPAYSGRGSSGFSPGGGGGAISRGGGGGGVPHK
jgi:hypothetical protein